MKKIEAMIQSMTREERANPKVISAGRKKRIAKGSATQVSDINKLLIQFEQMRKMMHSFATGKGIPGMMPPGGMGGFRK